MEQLYKTPSMENSEKKKRWSKEETKDDVTKRIEVEEVENGYVISKSKSWQDKEKGYQYVCKKYISKTNPMEVQKDEDYNLGNINEMFFA